MVELGIVDIREIIRLIKSIYGFDFSNYSLTSFKYRLENVIAKNNLNSPESLFRKLSDQPDFFDKFLHQISVPSSEMFRDPSVWRWLREGFFPSLDEKHLLNFKIWIPYCVSGGELFSLAIVLHELDMLDKVKIFATSFSDESIETIKSGEYPYKKIEISSENYRRFQGECEFTDYYKEEKYRVRRDTNLIKDVEFIKDDINFSNAPKNIKLILLRNVMIYFNPSFQESLLDKLHENLSGFGNLIIGLKEKIRISQNSPNLFDAVEPNEGVYKKRLV
jgi:chemotaxis protein methyltransferase CheR